MQQFGDLMRYRLGILFMGIVTLFEEFREKVIME